METHLIVVRPFDGLSRGDVITDAARIASIMASDNARHVVRVAGPAPGAA